MAGQPRRTPRAAKRRSCVTPIGSPARQAQTADVGFVSASSMAGRRLVSGLNCRILLSSLGFGTSFNDRGSDFARREATEPVSDPLSRTSSQLTQAAFTVQMLRDVGPRGENRTPSVGSPWPTRSPALSLWQANGPRSASAPLLSTLRHRRGEKRVGDVVAGVPSWYPEILSSHNTARETRRAGGQAWVYRACRFVDG